MRRPIQPGNSREESGLGYTLMICFQPLLRSTLWHSLICPNVHLFYTTAHTGNAWEEMLQKPKVAYSQGILASHISVDT